MVLVQSTGMAQWLQMTLGRALWDCRQYRVPAAGELYLGYVRARPERYSGRKRLQQAEHELEADDPPAAAPEEDDFILLRQYLSDDGDKRKLFQLAARVADLYDQYLVYRPEWLMRWEAGQRVEGLGDAQQWQAPLWQALVSYTAELGQPQWHRANLYQRFISTLEKADEPPAGLPSRVFICGISALPPVYLQALQALGKHVDVYVLFTNPCRYYWGDIKDPAFLGEAAVAPAAPSPRGARATPVSRHRAGAGVV